MDNFPESRSHYMGPTHGDMYKFDECPPAAPITVELIGMRVGGYAVEADTCIKGYLYDNQRAEVAVTEAEEYPEMVGRVVGLGMNRPLQGRFVPLPGAVAPKEHVAYYLTDELVDRDRILPRDMQNLAARYGRIVVDNVVFFDVRDELRSE